MVETMKQLKQFATALLLASGLFNTALAGTLLIGQTGASSTNTVVTQCVNNKGFFLEIGSSRSALVVKQGAGQNMPLSSVVRNILPPHWVVSFGREVSHDMPVAYSGAYTWTQRLKRIGQDKNLAIVINWHEQHVYINRL